MSFRFKTSTKVVVRFSDTDAMGHVNNARFFSYMEEGRVAYFSALMPEVDWNENFAAFPFILADIQCSFQAPAFCKDVLTVNLGVTRVGGKSFDLEYDLYRESDNTLIATGKSVQVMYDYKRGTSYPVPDDLKGRMTALDPLP